MSTTQLTGAAIRLIATLPDSARHLHHQQLDALLALELLARPVDGRPGLDAGGHRPRRWRRSWRADFAEWQDAGRRLLDADRALSALAAWGERAGLAEILPTSPPTDPAVSSRTQ